MSTVHVVLGRIDHHGDTLYGVYSTPELAAEAQERVSAASARVLDDVVAIEVEVDDDPRARWDE